MAVTIGTSQTVSPLDALWAHFMSQTKTVKKEFVKRMKEFELQQSKKNEIDLSLEEIKKGKTISFANADDAIAYLNS